MTIPQCGSVWAIYINLYYYYYYYNYYYYYINILLYYYITILLLYYYYITIITIISIIVSISHENIENSYINLPSLEHGSYDLIRAC